MTVDPEYEAEDVVDAGPFEPAAAFLIFQHMVEPVTKGFWRIFANEQETIGRQTAQECLGVEDRCISKHHLRIHCVRYENDEEHKVDPMVWARVLSNNAVLFNRKGIDDDENGGLMVDKDYGDFLLNEGDIIHLTSKIRIVYALPDRDHSESPTESNMDVIQIIELNEFAQHELVERYRISQRMLGWGGQSEVYAASDTKTGKQLACKIISQVRTEHQKENQMRPFRRGQAPGVARECNILKKLSHPNIIALEAVITTPYNVYIFQDLITGGDLMSYIEKEGLLKEPQAAVIVRQLLEAVQYLHANQIAHRDIKPENILMTSWKDGGRIVLTDFGHARTSEDDDNVAAKAKRLRMQTVVGTHGYVAPEVLHRGKQAGTDDAGYSQAVDIWSIGCVTCTLLSHDVLFQEQRSLSRRLSMEYYDQCMEKINSGRDWLHIHRRAKNFIKGCLELDEQHRLTATAALASEWFTHPHYRAEMDDAYKRAIADWKPKEHDEDKLILHIDTESAVGQVGQVRSHHFGSASVQPNARHNTNKQLHASPVVPNISTERRRESDDQSTFLSAPPLYDNDDFGDESLQDLTSEEYDNLQAVPATQFSLDCPPPPPMSPWKKACR